MFKMPLQHVIVLFLLTDGSFCLAFPQLKSGLSSPSMTSINESDGRGPADGRPAPNGPAQIEETNQIGEKQDFAGAGTLGDIMSEEDDRIDGHPGPRPSKAGLVTLEGGTLASRFGISNCLDRLALTANGNLQRIFSSYYDVPVHVVVDRCEKVGPDLWDRVVHLTVYQQNFCTAHASVTVHDEHCRELVQSGKVGLGQLFRYLDRLPTFELLDAGYSENGGLWRLYELKCSEISCRIREVFHPNAWKMDTRN